VYCLTHVNCKLTTLSSQNAFKKKNYDKGKLVVHFHVFLTDLAQNKCKNPS